MYTKSNVLIAVWGGTHSATGWNGSA